MNPSPAQPLISVVIPNHNGASYLAGCLSSLQRQTYPRVEVVVVDNASSDESVGIVSRAAPRAVLLRQDHNLGFAGGVNAGVRASRGDWIAVLNNDTEAAPDWLSECMRAAEARPEADFLACRILYLKERDRVFSAGDCFLRAGIGYRRGQELRDRAEYGRATEIFAASGCAALYRKSVWCEADGYDEHFFAYLEDVDLALRLQSTGHHGWYVPGAVVYHLGAGTSGGEFSHLAVRLRTRNSLLLLCKDLPVRLLWRSSPRILAAQFTWLARAVAHGRAWSYVRGLAGAVALLPDTLRSRRRLEKLRSVSCETLWQAILRSEKLARRDFDAPAQGGSTFLRWYFRLS